MQCPNNLTNKEPTCSKCGRGLCKWCSSLTPPILCNECSTTTHQGMDRKLYILLDELIEVCSSGRPKLSKVKHHKSEWYRYIIPRRLTLKKNPAIYRWLCWNFSWK